MTLRPVNNLVLIRPHIPPDESLSVGGIIMPHHTVITPEGRVLHESANPLYANQGEIVSIPADAREDLLPGDWVVFANYAGEVIRLPDGFLIAIPEDDVLAVLEEPEP